MKTMLSTCVVATIPENSPKHFWSFNKAKRTDHCGVAPLNHDDTVYSDSIASLSVYIKKLYHKIPTMECRK